jgi:hypothetical protein
MSTWTTISKPSRGVAPDGFMSSSGDGFDARPHTDGFFAPDGTWTPISVSALTWALVGKPSIGTTVRGALASPSIRGAVTSTGVRGARTNLGGNVWIPVTVEGA